MDYTGPDQGIRKEDSMRHENTGILPNKLCIAYATSKWGDNHLPHDSHNPMKYADVAVSMGLAPRETVI